MFWCKSIYKNKYFVFLLIVFLFIIYRSRTLENFTLNDSKILGNIKGKYKEKKREYGKKVDGLTSKAKNKIETFVRMHEL